MCADNAHELLHSLGTLCVKRTALGGWQAACATCTSARHMVSVPSCAGDACSACPSGVYTALSSRSSARSSMNARLTAAVVQARGPGQPIAS